MSYVSLQHFFKVSCVSFISFSVGFGLYDSYRRLVKKTGIEDSDRR